MSLGGGFECELVGGEIEEKSRREKEAATRDFERRDGRFKLLLIVSIIFFSSGQKFNTWKITNEASRCRLQRRKKKYSLNYEMFRLREQNFSTS